MRYVDTGSRNPKHSLGTYFSEVLLDPNPVVALRIQTGFFGAGALGYFQTALKHLAVADGPTRFLVGSNGGETTRAAVSELLSLAGPARSGLAIGVVSYQSGFFHPKVFHFQRADGSATAYVGSANLTPSGARSQHVEAGIIVDTRDGAPAQFLKSIADAMDDWFVESRLGMYPVVDEADLDSLVAAGVLGVVPPPRQNRAIGPAVGGHQKGQPGHSLKPLVAMPAISSAPTTNPVPVIGQAPTIAPSPKPATSAGTQPSSPPNPTTRVAGWGKKLPKSDAQRKAVGNQSGAIALTQGDLAGQIDQTTYFRQDLFGAETWQPDTANTGQPKEVATVPMHVTIDLMYHGALDFRISNASNRESGQNNYTAQLHLEPISSVFRQTDMTGKHLEIEHYSDGSYWLTIA